MEQGQAFLCGLHLSEVTCFVMLSLMMCPWDNTWPWGRQAGPLPLTSRQPGFHHLSFCFLSHGFSFFFFLVCSSQPAVQGTYPRCALSELCSGVCCLLSICIAVRSDTTGSSEQSPKSLLQY